ncbi:MAG: hypothetical protein B7Z31_05060 [Rhodobacterales bacterium 12-65-15]|nr:MAG: hypothetical protein B7Z31_05060 [Rhodobacterales bacterium 12-65-15]
MSQDHATIDRRGDGTSVLVTDHRQDGRVVLRLVTITGGGHAWPGGRARPGAGESQEIDASAEILRFFALYP